jgi:hypothetical protein
MQQYSAEERIEIKQGVEDHGIGGHDGLPKRIESRRGPHQEEEKIAGGKNRVLLPFGETVGKSANSTSGLPGASRGGKQHQHQQYPIL